MLEFHHSSIFLYTDFMRREFALQELQRLVLRCETAILYKPLISEADYNDHTFPLGIPANNFVLPNDKNSYPYIWATNCIAKFQNTDTFILIPGTRFDIHGTRRGKGAGWYDRFLSKVPPTWLRVGVTDKSRISYIKLSRQWWDEPVDWIVAYDGFAWDIYNTRAR